MHRHMTADISFSRPPPGGIQRDHLAYLRSRHNPVTSRTSSHPFGFIPQPLAPFNGPVHADPTGRPWPMLHTGPVFPGRGYLMTANSGVANDNATNFQQHPVYRSRSDETLSTISSRPSCQHRRIRQNGNDRSMRRKTEKDRRLPQMILTTTPGISTTEHSVDVSPSVEIPSTRHEIPTTAPKSSVGPTADSSSNPDSGYSGASGGGIAALRQLAPCSESSSLRSASSGEIAPCDPTLGSSCRTSSVPSVCNSL